MTRVSGGPRSKGRGLRIARCCVWYSAIKAGDNVRLKAYSTTSSSLLKERLRSSWHSGSDPNAESAKSAIFSRIMVHSEVTPKGLNLVVPAISRHHFPYSNEERWR